MQYITKGFAWLLLQLYYLVSNYGLAVILFAVIVKVIMLPFQMKAKLGTMRVARFSPRLKELEKKYEGNRQKYQEEVSKIYKEEKIRPMSGCLWNLIPFPILLALYAAIRKPLTYMMNLTADQITKLTDAFTEMGLYTAPAGRATGYSEIYLSNAIHNNFEAAKGLVSNIIDIDYSFLGLNLGDTPQWNFFAKCDWSNKSSWLPALGLFLIPIVSAALSWLAMKIGTKSAPQTADENASGKTMMLMMPLMSLWIGFVMPAALGVYWIMGSILGIIQDLILTNVYNKKLDKEDAERLERDRLRNEELERKRAETERLKAAGATTRNSNTSKKKIQANEKARENERIAAEKAAEKAKRRAALGVEEAEKPASQVGNRRYARGRAYVEDRFTNTEFVEPEATEEEVPAEPDQETEVFCRAEESAVEDTVNAEGADEE